MSFNLRPITASDYDDLQRIYGSTRAEELAPLGWSAHQQAAFVAMQFEAQSSYYAEQYPDGNFQIIMVDGEPAGRLYVDRRATEIRIVDIALLPAYRNRGIGSALLQALLHEGNQQHLPVTIHVESFNPALRLYQRLGFRVAEDKGVYLFMEKVPDAPQANRGQNDITKQPVATLRAADFAPYLKQTFTVHETGVEPVLLELIEVSETTQAGAPLQRQPFSLLFLGPESQWYLQQQTRRLEHPQFGTLDLFLVPLGPQAGRMRYQAIFN